MLTTTSEYKTEISKTGRHFLNKIIINETEYTGIKNFSYHGGTNSSDHISIGDAVSAYIEFTLTDCPSKMLTGQKATAYIGLKLSDSVEWIKMGIFHLDKPKRNGNYLDITAYDNFSLMEKGFYSDLSGNQKIVDILDEQCNKIGISFVGGADDVYYDVDLLKGSTVREAVAILAAYCGKNAIINRDGNLKFVWFDDIGVTLTDDYYNDTIEFDEEDTVIKRLDCTNETETLSIGTGIGIVFSCPGMTQERLNVLYNRINGFTYRAVSFDWQRARPDIEAGDMINLTIQGNNCSVPLMDFIVSCDGGCYGSIESKGKTQEEQDHEFTSPSEARYNFVYEEVISVKKVMADTIDAWQGNFESIETNFLTVNQKITALEGEFEKINVDELTARIATIEQAYISKVEAAELYATKAEIGVLDADVSNIKTLLAGSTTTGDLQSIVINSKNAIIENGTIKNAMIENLAFDKITGVDINTTKLTVHSADGKSKWQDNTIQISDSTRVRVQIGKDASNDYNIYIWDKTGKLMFDVTGVTADGIQRPIIRDDMVSDTANINGKKINIQSVVTEINNGTEKIKSSTVLYDPTGQTLNIAFNELVTTVDGIDKRVESNTTQISVANGEISTLISKTMQMQTDLSSAQGNITDLSTKYNQMKQTVDSYGVTIGEHTSQITSVRNDLDNLEVGGRNYFSHKKTRTFDENNEYRLNDYQNVGSFTQFYNLTVPMKTFVGKKLIISFEAISPNGDTNLQLYNSNGKPRYAMDTKIAYGITTEWKRFTVTTTVWDRGTTDTNEGNSNKLEFYSTNKMGVTIRNVKFEIGTKPTDWTPAPEDIESSITEVSDKQSSMQLDLDGFKTSVSNTYATKTQLNTVDGKFANYSTTTQMNSAIQQSANSIKSEVSSTYVTKTDFNSLEKDLENSISSVNSKVATIETNLDSVTSRVSATETSITTVDGKVTNLTSRVTTAESKLTATSLITTISSGINGGTALTTTKFIMDKNGLHIKGGGFDISNNAGTKVLSSDTSGNLSITGAINATSGKIGSLRVTSTWLMAGSGSTATGLCGDQAIWAGGEISNSAPFRVSYSGALVATNATITGTIKGSTITGSTITGGSITSGTTINVTTDLKVGNNIYINQNVYGTKYIYFTPNTYIRNLLTSSFNYIQMYSNYRSAIYVQNSSYGNATLAGWVASDVCEVSLSAQNASANYQAQIRLDGTTSSGISFTVNRNGLWKTFEFFVEPSGGRRGIVRPNADNACYLGSASYRWNTVFATNGVKTSSDLKQKEIVHRDMRAREFIMGLNPISYHRIDEESTGKRVHLGFGAQDVASLVKRLGRDDLSLVSAVVINGDEELPYYGEEVDDKNLRWGLNYSEFIPPIVSVLKTHDKEIAELKSEIMQLQSKLNALIDGTLEIKGA